MCLALLWPNRSSLCPYNSGTHPYENWQPDRGRNWPVSGHNPSSLACLGRDRRRHQFCIAVMCKCDICLAQLSAKTQPERTRHVASGGVSLGHSMRHLSHSSIGGNTARINKTNWLLGTFHFATQGDIFLAQISAKTARMNETAIRA